MAARRSWKAFPATYCANEIRTLAGWVRSGVSGSVVGLAGAGKSNLLGFVCSRPEALRAHLPPDVGHVVLIPVDLNALPTNDLATLYRLILRACHRVRDRFGSDLSETINDRYRGLDPQASRDPLLCQSALYDLFEECESQETRVVLVLDSFDRFCAVATPEMLSTLRGVRDAFKGTLSYIVGTRREVAYLFDPADLGEMYELLDTHVCWVQPLAEDDARALITRETHAAPTPPTEADVAHLLSLTGGYPALLKAACHWWLRAIPTPPAERWRDALLAERSIQTRLGEIWAGLSQEERGALYEVHEWQCRGAALNIPGALEARLGRGSVGGAGAPPATEGARVLGRLAAKGLCRRTDRGWQLFCGLFGAYVAEAGTQGGRIRLDERTGQFFRGPTPLADLTSLESSVLRFLITHPRARHAKTDLIINTWPEELRRLGVADESLWQVIRELRKKIEPDPGHPCYIVTWRGRPEGGYQFFPEGRPG